MRVRVLVCLIVMSGLIAGCTGEEDATTTSGIATTTSVIETTTTASTQTTPTEASTTTAPAETLGCFYVAGFVAIQSPDITSPEAADAVELRAIEILGEESAAQADAAQILSVGTEDLDDETLELLTAVWNGIDDRLGLISVGPDLDPLQASEDLIAEDPELIASPIHAMAPANHWLFKPGTDPVAVSGELPNPGGGQGDVIAVVDTGFAPGGPAWADQPYVEYETIDVEPPPFQASHGTFIAGLIRRVSPAHQVSVARARSYPDLVSNEHDDPNVPLTTELHAFEAVDRLLQRHAQDGVVGLNMSLGTYTCNPNSDALFVSLSTALQNWSTQFPGSQVFAAGGNEPATVPFWPGALPTVRAVGAANRAGNETVWGDDQSELPVTRSRNWIDDVAAGSELVSLAGFGATINNDLVSWSGSSFATAVAAALYARGDTPVQVPTNGRTVSWWLSQPVDYDSIPGLTYVSDNGSRVTVTTP
jgi:hypothetical protein